MADRPAPGIRCHGRVYVRIVPVRWSWKDVVDWIARLHLPKPTFVKMNGKGTDCQSCFCHWYAIMGQRQTFADHMNTQYLTHRKVEATVSLDMRAKSAQCLLQQQLSSRMWVPNRRGSCRGHVIPPSAQGNGYMRCPCCSVPPICGICLDACSHVKLEVHRFFL